jgi:hypothetical protein
VRDLGVVSFGPDLREGVADWNGEGEAVGGIVVMRYGQNALNVINGVKAKIAEIRKSLPPGVEIVAGYDRAGLIEASINTLKRDLLEEAIIVSLVIIVFPVSPSLRVDPDPHFAARRLGHVHTHVLFPGQFQHHVVGRPGIGDRRIGRCVDREGRKRLSASVGTAA